MVLTGLAEGVKQCRHAEVKITCGHRSISVHFITMTDHSYKCSVGVSDDRSGQSILRASTYAYANTKNLLKLILLYFRQSLHCTVRDMYVYV